MPISWPKRPGKTAQRPQVMRELMRTYIEQRRLAREYDDYLRRKVEAGRASMRAGRGRSNDEVEAAFAARRRQVAADQACSSSGRLRRNRIEPTFRTTSRLKTPDAAARLADHPKMGAAGKIPGTRELIPHESYRLVYEIDASRVWELALLHTSRQWPVASGRVRTARKGMAIQSGG